MSSVALLGLGAMGRRMAKNLLQAGHRLHVWNRSKAACQPLIDQGAQSYDTPRQAVQSAEVVISMLRDNQASEKVWLNKQTGALVGMRRDAIGIESSTLSIDFCRQLATSFTTQGINFLDAPVVGSRPQAEAGQLIHLVGGSSEVLAQARPVLETSASTLHHVGDHCSGMSMKLAVNALLGIQVAAIGEILGFLETQGIHLAEAADLLGGLPVASPAAKGAAMGIARQDDKPLFPIELVCKDLGYSLATDLNGESLPLTGMAKDLFEAAMQRGYGEKNIAAVAELFKP
jgi:3-hydroxyisobutyrate dehydrogenase-like beta-hydroxyacid dehydrogenase